MNIRVFFYDGADYSTGEMLSASVAFSKNYIEFIGYGLLPTDECSIIMRGTGLKDKNGEEIYEGDIIKSNVEPRPGNIIEVVGEVYFDEKLGGYMFGNKHSTDKESDTVEFGVCMALSDSVEIIGNIYNNPDLFFCVTEADA